MNEFVVCPGGRPRDEDFGREGLLTYLPRDEFDRVGMEEEPGFLLDLNLNRKYFGKGYERGDAPLFVGISEYLEKRLPGARIFYGEDCSGDVFPFGQSEREALLRLYREARGEP